MEISREISFSEMGYPLLIINVFLIALLFLSIIAALETSSPNLIANCATVFFIAPTIINGLVGYFLGRKGVKRISELSIVITVLFLLVGVFLLYDAVMLAYQGIIRKPKITHFEIALTIPIILIIITYIASEFCEKKIPEIYWRTSRVLGDRIRGVLSSAGLAIIGPTGAFFGVMKMDPLFALFTILYSLVELWRTAEEIKFILGKGRLLSVLRETAERTFKAVPVIHDVKIDFMNVSGRFVVAQISSTVSKFVEEEYVEALSSFMLTELINRLAPIVYLRVVIKLEKPKALTVAVALGDGEIVSKFPSKRVIIVTFDASTREIKEEKIIELKFDEYEKVPEAKAIENLARNRVLVLATKDISEIAKNVARNWFIRVIKTEKENLKDVLEEITQRFLS